MKDEIRSKSIKIKIGGEDFDIKEPGIGFYLIDMTDEFEKTGHMTTKALLNLSAILINKPVEWVKQLNLDDGGMLLGSVLQIVDFQKAFDFFGQLESQITKLMSNLTPKDKKSGGSGSGSTK